MSEMQTPPLDWHRVLDADELPEGRVTTVTAGHRSVALTHHDGSFGLLRCPWHNNGQLAKISKEQRAGEWDVWQTELHNPDFSKYAELCGALGIRVTQAGEPLDDALTRALAHNGPSLVEVMTDPELI